MRKTKATASVAKIDVIGNLFDGVLLKRLVERDVVVVVDVDVVVVVQSAMPSGTSSTFGGCRH